MTLPADQLSDAELVMAFAQRGSHEAFALIVQRHTPAVFASARRQLGDASVADDVTQAVFILLASKAGTLPRPELLGGWLMRATRYCAMTVRRSEKRRAVHEGQAARPSDAAGGGVGRPEGLNLSADVLPLIDEAMAKLNAVDRTIVTLGVIESRSLVEIGQSLQMSADAVRKRLPRAIDKIRRHLSLRGIAVSAEGMATALQPIAMPHDLVARVLAAHTSHGTAAHAIANAVSHHLAIKATSTAVAFTTAASLFLVGTGTAIWLAVRGVAAGAQQQPAPLPHSNELGNVYFSPDNPSAGWTQGPSAVTPKTGQPFFGPFGNQNISLRLAALPKHDFLHVQADLYIIDSWDGIDRLDANLRRNGPDFWTMRLDDRPALVRTTFSATPDEPVFAFGCKLQTYPAVVPTAPRPAGTGAYLVNGLGYVFTFSNALRFPMDGAYHLDFMVPHSADSAGLTVGGDGLGTIDDESWGITNVKIDAIPASAVAEPTGDQLQSAWRTATGPDPVRSHDAFWQLVAGGDATVRFLQRLPVAAPFNSADVLGRQANLSSQDPETAFAARQDLIAMGPAVETLLTADGTGGDDNPATHKLLEAIELSPIADPPARAAATKAKLLAAINTPLARTALRTWLDTGAAWKPNSMRQFESAYHLPDKANIILVSEIDERIRDDYFRRRREIVEDAALRDSVIDDAPDAGNVSHVFMMADAAPNLWTPALSIFPPNSAGWNRSGQYPPLRQLLTHCRWTQSTTWSPVQVDPELTNLPLKGDWLVRYNPSSETALLNDLAVALSKAAGTSVAAKPITIPQITTVFTGTPRIASANQPPSVTRSVAIGPDHSTSTVALEASQLPADTLTAPQTLLPAIDLYANEPDRAATPQLRQTISLRNLPAYLSRYGRLFKWGMTPTADVRVELLYHPAALRSILIDDSNTPENAALVDSIVNNLVAQLGVTITSQSKPIPAFRLTIAK